MRSKAGVSLFMALCVACAVTMTWSQEITGTMAGTVTDSSGSVISGATITVTNTDKNIVIRTLTSDENGGYVATLLPIGHYSVTAQAQGFRKTTKEKVELNVNDKLTLHFVLEVGGIAEAVTVEASAIQVELQSPAASGLISGTQVRELALNNRNYEQLVTLMPGVTSNASDQIYIGTTNPSGQTNVVSFSINGNRNSANNWTIDGADNVDRGSNLTLLNYPSVDAIAEFKVLRGLYSAEFGRSASGQVNVITKSGGSGFHGNAYEFFRNDKLAANNFLNKVPGFLGARPPLRYNDFGYTVGGPVFIPGHYNTKKDKTFFFFSQEFRRVINYATFQATVPTGAEKAGNFASPVCVASSGTVCTQQVTQISPINAVAAAYIKDIYSNIPGPTDLVTHSLFTQMRSIFNHRQELVRIDHVFGPRLSLAGRYLSDSIPTQEPGGLFTDGRLPGVQTTNTNSPGHNWTFRYTATFSPTFYSEGGYSYSYGAIISRPAGSILASNSPDIRPLLPFPSTLNRVPSLAFSGNTVPPTASVTGFGPYDDFNRDHNVFENMSKISGRHTWKFGATYHHYQKTENAAGNNAGTFTFSNNLAPPGTSSFQQAWANFLLGNVATYTQTSLDLTPDVRAHQLEFYGQDEYRARSNLTLSWGLRYSLFAPAKDKNGFLTNFDRRSFDPTMAPQVSAATGNITPGTGDPLNGIIVANQNSPWGQQVQDENSKNVAPRVGVAWDPWKNGKTSVRAGYGIFFDAMLFGIVEQNTFSNPPFLQNISISNTRLENPGSVLPTPSAAPKTLRAIPLPNHTPYVQQWSLDVQRDVAKNLIVDVGYYGSKGTHLIGIIDINMVPVGVAAAGGFNGPYDLSNTARFHVFRPFRGYGPINAVEAGFDSNYHSLQVAVQKRFTDNSLLNFAYTWSKSLTDNGSDRSNAPQNSYDIHADYGLAPLDRRHVFTANYVYEFPWLKNQEGVVGHLLGGWEISGIVTYNSGLPLTVTSSRSLDYGGQGILGPSAASPRPDIVGDPNDNAPRTFTQWFNTAVFRDVPAGQIRPGNSGRGVVRGPGLGRWDFSAFKNIRFGEAVKLQFRVEFFNIFNHANVSTVTTGFGSGTFGRVSSYRDPRIVQLALKFAF